MTQTHFSLTRKQEEAIKLFSDAAAYILLYGGARSAKTFTILRTIAWRALAVPKSRHAVLRYRFNHVKASVVYDTFPKMMELCFPGCPYKLDKSDWYVGFPNDSQIWFGGLDDKERTEKILGNEYATIFLNEISQISYQSFQIVVTRLAQKVVYSHNGEQKELRLKFFLDENPTTKAHWSYKLFINKQDPETKRPLAKPDNYAVMQMNPRDNADNLPKSYLEELQLAPERYRRRFWAGDFGVEAPNQLFSEVFLDKFRKVDGEQLPDFVRVVVGVDPSGADEEDNAGNDAIGIVVGALGVDGIVYLLEDCTVKTGPATWGNVAATAYERHNADCVVGEENFGGAMVKFVLRTANNTMPYKSVSASRGKVLRIEPFSALYEQGKVCHVGYFRELEDELLGFTTTGYKGTKSPNRADAWVWVLTELFPGMVKGRSKFSHPVVINKYSPFGGKNERKTKYIC